MSLRACQWAAESALQCMFPLSAAGGHARRCQRLRPRPFRSERIAAEAALLEQLRACGARGDEGTVK